MPIDLNLPKTSLEQQEAEHIIHDFAQHFHDVAYTDPKTGKTGFTARTLDNELVVSFGYDQSIIREPNWYYSVMYHEDTTPYSEGNGFSNASEVEQKIIKLIQDETWRREHSKELKEHRKEKLEHEQEFSEGVISIQQDQDGLYPTEAA